ncbi:MAG: hypothetical protein RIR70_138, partial [Pseudomonadota bacterium]
FKLPYEPDWWRLGSFIGVAVVAVAVAGFAGTRGARREPVQNSLRAVA